MFNENTSIILLLKNIFFYKNFFICSLIKKCIKYIMKGYMKIIGLLILIALLIVVSQIQRIEESFTTNIIQEGEELHQLNQEILNVSPEYIANEFNLQ
jgi:hypothetical protein